MGRRTARGGAALVVAVAMAMSACGGNGATPEAGGGVKPTEAAKDASTALIDAATTLQKQSFKSVIDMGEAGTVNGVMDPVTKTGEFLMEAESDGTTVKTEMRIVGGVNYVRLTIPGADIPGMDGTTWRKLSGAGGTGTLGGFDASDTVKSLEAASEVAWAGDDAVTGTIDLTKAGQQLGMGADVADKLATKTVPFQAGFDGEGRLVRYSVTVPGVGSEPATTMNMTYSDFGLPVTVKAPAASEIATS
ncbi:hypothetical protein FB565_004293 [Actinoplanes lutulentus]|uniref:Lipoprotein LprG n=1 Tax=Actinoplanes lutulentus TaxID=1287878 RepID=A0A327ZH05_9ACTN|nr:hypothetical protein [Actinoplanes lutulentus]MBB2944564.1 hypothetical protein [Actinoplanes lutulentus]RAK42207.1 hypothetical protein B0I29_10228 [Actinoplanes lutulentus]